MQSLKGKTSLAIALGSFFALASQAEVNANPSINNRNELPSQSLIASKGASNEKVLKFDLDPIHRNQADCNIFDDPRSVACLGSFKGHNPSNNLESIIQKSANYVARFVPMLNSNAGSNEYIDVMKNDGRRFLVDSSNGLANSYLNNEIQKIPFFAQTTIALNAGSVGDKNSRVSLSIDSLMKLKEMGVDEEGDLKTLLFSQAKLTAGAQSKGATTNLGLGIRHRPNDESMLGANAFLDYRTTNYSTAHTRIGLGGEYLWKDFEVRNNWYLQGTGKKEVTVDGGSYTEKSSRRLGC